MLSLLVIFILHPSSLHLLYIRISPDNPYDNSYHCSNSFMISLCAFLIYWIPSNIKPLLDHIRHRYFVCLIITIVAMAVMGTIPYTLLLFPPLDSSYNLYLLSITHLCTIWSLRFPFHNILVVLNEIIKNS